MKFRATWITAAVSSVMLVFCGQNDTRSTSLGLSASERAWLLAHSHPLQSTTSSAGDFDLKPIASIAGKSRILALGEGTHGTSEFFSTKARIALYAMEHLGYRVFAMEAQMPEAAEVNQWLDTGEGDVREAVAGMGFWTWRTEEFLQLLQSMRKINVSRPHSVEFWGFDGQFPFGAIRNLEAFFSVSEPAYLPRAAELRTLVKRLYSVHVADQATRDRFLENAREMLEPVRSRRGVYLRRSSASNVDWIEQNARIVLQAARSETYDPKPHGLHRDEDMAENVSWILTHHPPGSRVVLWAHNSHVSHNQQYMGGHLAMKYRDYRAIGFATQTGSYTARGCRGLGAYPLLTAPPDTIEQTVFSVVPQREFILDLRAAGHLWSSGRWLLDPHPFRNIGAAAMPECADEASLASRSRQQIGEGGAKYGFYPIPLARWFDAVVFIARTTPSHVFPRMRASGAGTSTPCR